MPALLVLVNGLPGAGKTTLARRLAPALSAVLISKDDLKEALHGAVPGVPSRALGFAAMDAAWTLATGVSGTVVLESWWFAPRDRDHLRAGLAAVAPARAVEVWCDVPAELARSRYAARQRDAMYEDAARLATDWALWADQGRPVGLTPVVRVATSEAVDVAGLAERVEFADRVRDQGL